MRWALLIGALWMVPHAALALPPPSFDAANDLIARGDTSFAAGDSISAIAYYRDAISRAPRDARGYVALGRAYLQVDEPKHALETFQVGARNTRGSEPLALGLAHTFAALNQPAQALHALRTQAAQGTPSLLLLDALATALQQGGAFGEALAVLRRALRMVRRDAPDHESLREREIRVRALSLMLGEADRVGPTRCDAERDVVLQRLLGCP